MDLPYDKKEIPILLWFHLLISGLSNSSQCTYAKLIRRIERVTLGEVVTITWGRNVNTGLMLSLFTKQQRDGMPGNFDLTKNVRVSICEFG